MSFAALTHASAPPPRARSRPGVNGRAGPVAVNGNAAGLPGPRQLRGHEPFAAPRPPTFDPLRCERVIILPRVVCSLCLPPPSTIPMQGRVGSGAAVGELVEVAGVRGGRRWYDDVRCKPSVVPALGHSHAVPCPIPHAACATYSAWHGTVTRLHCNALRCTMHHSCWFKHSAAPGFIAESPNRRQHRVVMNMVMARCHGSV